MKLRSGKTVSLSSNSIELELKKTVDTLKVLLKDDRPFLKKIVEMSLSLGKEVYRDEIDRLIGTKYSDPTLGGHDRLLLYTTFDLGRLIGGDHPLIRQELAKLPIKAHHVKKWRGVQDALRIEIEKEVNNMFEELDVESPLIDITGESSQSFNEIDI